MRLDLQGEKLDLILPSFQLAFIRIDFENLDPFRHFIQGLINAEKLLRSVLRNNDAVFQVPVPDLLNPLFQILKGPEHRPGKIAENPDVYRKYRNSGVF